MPNPAKRTFRHVSRFASPLHGVPNPTIRLFLIVSRFGSTLHGEPSPTMRSLRVVSCFMGCPIPELGLCQQQVHRLSRYPCVFLCVSRQCAEPHALRTPPPKKNSLAVRPIYPFPRLQTPRLARDDLPAGGGGGGRQGTVSRGGGGGLQGYFKAKCGTLHRCKQREHV